MLMAAPLIILYGVSILVAKMINPYKEEDDEEDTDTNEQQEQKPQVSQSKPKLPEQNE